jgi:hypothetical protein
MGALAAELGLGESVDLIAQPADPKDLYAELAARQPVLRAA